MQQHADVGGMSIIFLDPPLAQRLEGVKQDEGTRTLDRTLSILVDGYEWLHRGGSHSPLLPFSPAAARVCSSESIPRPYAIRQETEQRLVAIDPAKAAKGVGKVIEQVLLSYEWLMQGGLAKEFVACRIEDAAGAWLHVAPHLKSCLEELGERRGDDVGRDVGDALMDV
jgi:hypothetical protein